MSSHGRINFHIDNDDELIYIHESPKHHSSQNHNVGNVATSDEQLRRRQEEEESIELARQLMAEEAMNSYEQHYQLLRESAHQLSQEDYDALQRALGEDEFEADGQVDQSGELSYDAMLDLSERIGDVKTERWAMISAGEVEKLPTFFYNTLVSTTSTKNNNTDICNNIDDSERKCLVCQFEYENSEILRRLPCGHCFHKSCVDTWLHEKDVCPYCRQCIV